MLYKKPVNIELIEDKLIVEGKENEFSVRKLSDMQDVLMGMKTVHPEEDRIVYYMYRNVVFADTLRYDITYVTPTMLYQEYPKTFGHYHPIAEKKLSYPEIYHVLRGEATYLLQKNNTDGSVDVMKIKANEGDVVLIPPNYGHVTINAAEKGLIMANVVSSKFKSEYDYYRENKGAAYYLTKEGYVQNQNYIVREFKKIEPKELNREYGLIVDDLLEEFYSKPEKFEFLEKPSLLFG